MENVVDIKRMKETFGGLAGRMYLFGTGKFGDVMNTYAPEIDLFEAIRAKKIIYVALPTMGKNKQPPTSARCSWATCVRLSRGFRRCLKRIGLTPALQFHG